MGRLLRYLAILVVLVAIAGVIYAVVADLPAPLSPVEVELPGAALK